MAYRCTLVSLIIGLPAAPPIDFSALASIANPAQQLSWPVTFGATYPLPISGQVVLTFVPDAGLTDDPAIQFSIGGRTVNYSIAAGTLKATPAIAFQTGTVSGTIVLTVNLSAAGQDITPSPAPSFSIRIGPQAPVITSVVLSSAVGGFNVQISGYATSRQVTVADFQFNPPAGSTLQTTQLTVQVQSEFIAWYQSAASVPYGSQFTFNQFFEVKGSLGAIASVTVNLENAQGKSPAVTGTF
jgi:hypothetical protein